MNATKGATTKQAKIVDTNHTLYITRFKTQANKNSTW
jgi:hypothetical protein